MKFNQLRDFVAVAEKGSLRAAARALGLAQPAITRSIQELEHSLGAQLFIREARGVTLTPIGEGLLLRAINILGDVRRAREAVSQQQGSAEGELVVGLSIAGHLGILGQIIRPFRQRYPRVNLRVIEGLLPTLDADLRNGVVDLYVGPVLEESAPVDMHVTKLFDNRRVVIARRGHPLGSARKLSDLADAAWLTTSITHNAADELTTIFAEHRLPKPNLVCQCQSALSILTILVNSDILAMVPVQWMSSPVLRGWLDSIALEETFTAPPIMLIHRAGIGLTPAAQYFTHLVAEASRLHADSA